MTVSFPSRNLRVPIVMVVAFAIAGVSAPRPTLAQSTNTPSSKSVAPAVTAKRQVAPAKPYATPSTATAPKSTAKPVAAKAAVAKTAVPAGGSSEATPPAKPAPRLAGDPVVGWGRISADEWPALGSAVVVRGLSSGVDVFRGPDDFQPALHFSDGKAATGKMSFLVVGQRGDRLKVSVPVRPNGTVGWVRAADVAVETNDFRITVELATHTLTLTQRGRAVLRSTVAVGTGGTPTPVGLFYVKEFVPQANPGGALGPIVLGLSGFSDVLYSFNGGQGAIGLHGTNQPGRLGNNVSHGCIRVDNAVVRKLADIVPLGTPVEILHRVTDRPIGTALALIPSGASPTTSTLAPGITTVSPAVAPSTTSGSPVTTLELTSTTVSPTSIVSTTVVSTTIPTSTTPATPMP